MSSLFFQEFIAYIKSSSWKFNFITVIFAVDLTANWYLYSRHPPVPSVNQRCSTRYPEFSMILEHPVSLPDGSIQAEDGTIYSSEQFYYENYMYKGCPCSVKPCIRKCCSGQNLFNEHYNCMPFSQPVNVSDFINSIKIVSVMNVSENYFSVLSSKCERGSTLQNITLLEDGRILSSSEFLDQSQYCLEMSSERYRDVIAVSCVADSFDKDLTEVRKVKAHALRVIFFILHVIIFLLYILLPSLRCGVGCLLVHLVAAMILKGFFNIVVIAQLGRQYRIVCTVIGLAMQYSWLSCQTWQLVIAFQIWASFRPGTMQTQTQVYTKLPLYRGLAWGLPLLLTASTLTVDLTSFIPASVKPQMGLKKCWFSNESTRFLYAVVPVDVTELVTLSLCVMTLLRLRTCQHSSAALCSSSLRNWTRIYVRACFVMGSAYILVSLMALITWNYKSMRGIPPFLVETVKDIERARGVEIFFIFVLKKGVIKQLLDKFHCLVVFMSEEQASPSEQQTHEQALEQ